MYTPKSQNGLLNTIILGWTAWFGLLAAPSSFAFEDEQSDIYDLHHYVVISSRTELPLDQVGSTVDVLTAADFEKTKQPFIIEALRTIPGLLLRNNGGPGQVFGMTTRGLNANRPTVLIDGVEVSNPGSGQIINFGSIASSNVQRVEVLKGAQSSLYGADAVAGVISIHTRDGSGEPGSSLDVTAGSFNTYQAAASTWGNAEGWTYNLSFAWHDSGGFSVQDPAFGDAWVDDDLYRNLNVSLNLGYALSETTSFRLVAYYIDSKAEFDPGDPAWVFGEPFADNFTDTEQLFSKVSLQFEPSDTWESSLAAGYNSTRDTSFSQFPFSSHGDRFEVDWNNTVRFNDTFRLVGGAQYEKEENKSDAGKRNEKSLYVENIVFPSEKLTLTAGGRVDDNSTYGEEFTYRGTFSYLISETEERFLKLRGSYGTSFQAPTFFQLFSFFGNPDLNPESGTGWDIGFEGSTNQGALTLGITYFDYDIKDKFIFDLPNNTYANEERYFSQGFESYARLQVTNAVDLSLAHTYAYAEYIGGVKAERVPENTYSLTVNWETLRNQLTLSATGLYVDSQLSLRGDTVSMPSYSVINVAGTFSLSETLELWARIDNLFDEYYQEVFSYETPGFSVYGGVKIRF